MGESFCLVTPGIRPVDASHGEQKRITTPRQAIENGADYLVIGRPVTQARRPGINVAAIERGNRWIEDELGLSGSKFRNNLAVV